jgi:hypothetical protein
MTRFDEARLAKLIAALPPPPAAWVVAAQELPVAARKLDELVARAEADVAVRAQVLADLERALAAEGVEPTMRAVEALRRRLDLR